MRLRGIVFAGTSTQRRPAMRDFLRDVLGLRETAVDGIEADVFRLPDGDLFAVASPLGMGPTERSIGFLVDDLDAAVEELRSAGVEVDAPAANVEERYVHFVAPDGQVYELVERIAARRPIFHLSIPVRDLEEAVSFYRQELGAEIGRRTDTFADALVFGAQVTLQNDPASVSDPMPRTRHFGVTMAWSQWESVSRRFAGRPLVVEAPTISYEGEPGEQAKLMIRDPSGNLIEIKAYRHPEQVLGSVAGS